MHCGDLNGKEVQKRGDICIFIAGSFGSTVETLTLGLKKHTDWKCGYGKRYANGKEKKVKTTMPIPEKKNRL